MPLTLKPVINRKRIDVALISETHFTKFSHIHIPGYTLIKSNHSDNTAHGGAAIFIKSNIEFYPLPRISQSFLQSCAINLKLNNTSLTIAAVYLPPKYNIKNTQFADYFNSFNNNFIIGGDFNAKHQS
jgi:exonuclease III